jgi:hypothetical protein
MDNGFERTQPPLASDGQRQAAAPMLRHVLPRWRRSFSRAVGSALIVIVSAVALISMSVHPHERVVAGSARAAYPTGPSDEDQIRDVLQAISHSYNEKDVKSAEDQLCWRARAQWSTSLEQVWMRYRLRHGPFQFIVGSIHVSGVVADVTGRQTYANDTAPKDFTAAMEHERDGWKMCSST